MRRPPLPLIPICFCFILSSVVSLGAASREDELIAVIAAATSPRDKDAACAELKLIGTEKCIEPVATLLLDEQFSQSARYVLEPMQSPLAGQALLRALPRTSGPLKLGIIESLGVRRETAAIPSLITLIGNEDSAVAGVAVASLARVGGPGALAALSRAVSNPNPAVRRQVLESALALAEQTRLAGDARGAGGLFQAVAKAAGETHFQVAGYRGLILSAGADAPRLLELALSGSPGPRQTAALAACQELVGPQVTRAMARALEQGAPTTRVALLELLAQRNDRAALPAAVQFASSGTGSVRVAAILAVGKLGDGANVPLLAELAAAGSREEQAAAFNALVNMQSETALPALLTMLGDPAAQTTVARVLGERGEREAAGQILTLAKSLAPVARGAALEAAGALAREQDIAALLDLVVTAEDDSVRTQAAEALNTAYQRLLLEDKADPGPLSDLASNGSPHVRSALFPLCSGLPDPRTRAALLKGASETNPQVRSAAIRSMASSQDPALLPELTKLGCTLTEPNLRTLAISGAVRLGTDERSGEAASRIDAFQRLLGCNPGVEPTRMLISGLARVPHPRSLQLAEDLLRKPGVSTEAARAVIQISPAIPNVTESVPALEKVISTVADPETLQVAQLALEQIRALADYLRSWQLAGPFRREGSDYAALFDVPFPPEARDVVVQWSSPNVALDPHRPGVVDLLKTFGGEQCVAYARTWVHSPGESNAILELGSDDGVKVWLNGALVYANNVARPLQSGSDKAPVSLKAGWNSLMLKVTQNNLGWEFCARFRKPDGSRLEGLKFAVEPPSI